MVATVRPFFIPNRGIIKVLGLNFLVGLGFLASFWLAQRGFPYLAALFGAVTLFLPAVNVALAVEQLTEHRERLSTLLLWSTIFTLTATPAAVQVIGKVVSGPVPALYPIVPFLMWWGLSIVGLFTVSLIKQVVPGWSDTRLDRKNFREGVILLAIFLAIMLANFVIYPFIPEGDGYTLLIAFAKGEAHPAILAAEPRILFFVLMNLWAKLLQLDPYWILKVILPLCYLVVVATVYLIARPLVERPSLRILAALSPLLFPVVLQESLISRPQSIAVLALVPALYLVGKMIAERLGMRQLYWLLALIGVGIVGLKTHTLLFLVTILGLLAVAIVVWPEAKKRPLDSLIFLVATVVVLYPWIAPTRVLAEIWHLATLLGQALKRGEFDLWFIDNYRNADGQELGWPGLSSLFYYGYNIGLFLPALLGLAIITLKRKALSGFWQKPYWAIGGILVFFFVIAEILPRFHFAYMPDRAWLFVVLATSLLIPRVLAALSNSLKRWLLPLVVGSALLSLLVGTSLTYAKQGWIIREEYAAADFVRNQTPQDAIFLGGGGIMVLVRHYGERILIRPPDSVFLSDEELAVEKYLAEAAESYQPPSDLLAQRRTETAARLARLGEAYRSSESDEQDSAVVVQLHSIIAEIEKIPITVDVVDQSLKPQAPVYLVYSRHKFDSLYGSRGWWRTSNFYGANVDKFSVKYPVVYDKDGVTIWKVRP